MSKIIHVVTEDFKNPNHDKRCKYGWKGVNIIKKGTLLEEMKCEKEVAGVTINYSVYYYCYDNISAVFHSIPTEIRELKPSEQFIVNHNVHGRFGHLICHLLDAGKITNADIDQYYDNLPE